MTNKYKWQIIVWNSIEIIRKKQNITSGEKEAVDEIDHKISDISTGYL